MVWHIHASLAQRTERLGLAVLLALVLAVTSVACHASAGPAVADGALAEWMADDGHAAVHGDDERHCAVCTATANPVPLDLAGPERRLEPLIVVWLAQPPLPPEYPPRT